MVASVARFAQSNALGNDCHLGRALELFYFAPIHRDFTESVALEGQRGPGRFHKVSAKPLSIGEKENIGIGLRCIGFRLTVKIRNSKQTQAQR